MTPPVQASGTRLKVLIADDDSRLRDLMQILLRDQYDVDVAESGEEALLLVEETDYDAFLCDLSMPNAGAREVYDRLRSTHPETARRLVVVSGGAFTAEGRHFLATSGCPSLPKPFGPKDVALAVENVIQRARRHVADHAS